MASCVQKRPSLLLKAGRHSTRAFMKWTMRLESFAHAALTLAGAEAAAVESDVRDGIEGSVENLEVRAAHALHSFALIDSRMAARFESSPLIDSRIEARLDSMVDTRSEVLPLSFSVGMARRASCWHRAAPPG